MVQHTARKIAEVQQRLDAFEMRVLARPAPPVDVSTLQAAVDSLRADIDMILELGCRSLRPLLSSLLKTQCWQPYLPPQRFHHLPLGSMQRGVGVEQRTRH